MAAKRKQKSEVVRCFDVSDPTLHPKGHTIYKITQKLIPVDSPDKNVEQIVVWRRYNDLKKLYKAMLNLHNALHRKEQFPPFAKATAFGRFDKDIIIERQRCAQDLLNFIAQRHYFVISKAFQQFFEDGEKSEVLPSERDILQPSRLSDLTHDDEVTSTCTQDSDIESVTSDLILSTEGSNTASPVVNRRTESGMPDEIEIGDIDGEVLGGVWKYRQIADNISLGELDDDDDNSYFTDDSTLSTPLPSAEVAFFDPLSVQNTGKEDQTGNSVEKPETNNEWLLAAMKSCGVTPGDQDTPTSSGTPEASVNLDGISEQQQKPTVLAPKTLDLSQKPSFFFENSSEDEKQDTKSKNDGGVHESASCDNFSSNSKIKNTVQHGKGDLNFSPLSTPPDDSSKTKVITSSSTGTLNQTNNAQQVTSSKKNLTIPGKESGQELPRIASLLNLDIKDKGDYIFQAANQISLGQQCEASGNYHMAFNYFRTGVGILLTGVQLDENSARREVVRRKTAKYLVKAEKLHKKYLESNGENSITDRWDPGKISPTKVLEPLAACLQGSLTELVNYKVIGMVDQVMLVINSETENTFVMKILQKSCIPSNKKRNIVPTHCPYMVQLHRFYETEHAVILVLQHAPGGKLWNYISNYLHNTNQNEVDGILNDEHERELRYAGRSQIENKDVHTNVSNQHAVHRLGNNQLNEINLNDVNSSDSKYIKQSESDGDIKIALGSKSSVVRFKPMSNEYKSNSENDPKINSHVPPSDIGYNNNSNTIIDETELDKPKLLMGQTSSHFQDLLKSTSEKPTMEAFSVNSFESDSGPGSRFESVADHIESIEEVSETNTPLGSPHKVNGSKSCFTEVFQDNKEVAIESIVPAENISHKVEGVTDEQNLVADTHKILQDLDKELEETDKAFNEFLNNDAVFSSNNRTSPKRDQDAQDVVNSTPKAKNPFSSTESKEEKGIYDYNRSPSLNSSSSVPEECLDVKTNVEIPPSKNSFDIVTRKKESKNLEFGQPSQERSQKSDIKPRNRTVSVLSSVFGDLDVVSEEKRASIRLPENCIRQWAAELVLALEYLHYFGLACRDLNPDNLLLGSRGHVTLSYFSQWSSVNTEISQSTVNQFYTAPEVISLDDCSAACDWWSLGALLFELFTGKKLYQYYPSGITSHTQLEIPGDLSSEAKALLKDLLKFSPEERLGATGGGVDDIKSHPFFQGIDWNQLANI